MPNISDILIVEVHNIVAVQNTGARYLLNHMSILHPILKVTQ